ncbi:hypothetical protein [Luteimonas abyssi]|uniref:hypothetical protein n=1 Tax=Luteimonas abyssi TaxID=1247514 RepID=UPI000AD85725|nr:hypothetical protein [Luteimonas abyssi]
MSDWDATLQDHQAVEAAGLHRTYKLAASTTLASLRYLQHLGAELEKPVDEITREEIIAAFKAEDVRFRGPAA